MSKEAPVGFRAIRLAFELETDASDEDLDTLLRLTERYCVVYQTIASGPALSASWTTVAAEHQRLLAAAGPRTSRRRCRTGRPLPDRGGTCRRGAR